METIEAPGHPKVLSVGLRFDSIKPNRWTKCVFEKLITYLKGLFINWLKMKPPWCTVYEILQFKQNVYPKSKEKNWSARLYKFIRLNIFSLVMYLMVLDSLVGHILDDELFWSYCFTYTTLIASHSNVTGRSVKVIKSLATSTTIKKFDA